MSVRILITGVSGQVGSALVPVFERLGQVIAADRKQLDLARPDDLGRILNELTPNLIINSAAYTAVDKAEGERELAFRINATAPGILARWAADRDVPLVHFSTDYVYDGHGTVPFLETDRTAPLSAYGQSKLEGDLAVGAAGGISLIVRTSWVYAASGKNFLTTIARLAGERDELRVVCDQFGAPTSAAFIAASMATMLGGDLVAFRDRCRQADGIVHLTAGGVTNWCEFATAIVDGLRARGAGLATKHVRPITTAEYPALARRPENSRLDLRRLAQVFGIKPPAWQALLKSELDKLTEKNAAEA